jgi:hypothetical protein
LKKENNHHTQQGELLRHRQQYAFAEIAYCYNAGVHGNMITIADLQCSIWEFFPAM